MRRLLDAGLGPGGLRAIVVIGVLSAVRAASLVMIAESLAGSIAAIAGGTQGWRDAILLGVIGAVLRAGSTWAVGTVAAHEARIKTIKAQIESRWKRVASR